MSTGLKPEVKAALKALKGRALQIHATVLSGETIVLAVETRAAAASAVTLGSSYPLSLDVFVYFGWKILRLTSGEVETRGRLFHRPYMISVQAAEMRLAEGRVCGECKYDDSVGKPLSMHAVHVSQGHPDFIEFD